MAEKTVPLSAPIKGHGGDYTAVVLREPTAREYLEIGEPKTLVRHGDSFVFTDNDVAIADYVRRCIKEPVADLVLGQVSLRDAISIREAVLGFFTDARSTEKTG